MENYISKKENNEVTFTLNDDGTVSASFAETVTRSIKINVEELQAEKARLEARLAEIAVLLDDYSCCVSDAAALKEAEAKLLEPKEGEPVLP
jgi:hypothetical protein